MENRAVGTKTRFLQGPWQACRGPALGLQKVVVVIILENTCPVFYKPVPLSNTSPCSCKHNQPSHTQGPDFFLRVVLENMLPISSGLRSHKVQSCLCHPLANLQLSLLTGAWRATVC